MTTAYLPDFDQTQPFVPRRSQRRVAKLFDMASQKLRASLESIMHESRVGRTTMSVITVQNMMDVAQNMKQFPYMNSTILAYALDYYQYLGNKEEGEEDIISSELDGYVDDLIELYKQSTKLDINILDARLREELIRYIHAVQISQKAFWEVGESVQVSTSSNGNGNGSNGNGKQPGLKRSSKRVNPNPSVAISITSAGSGEQYFAEDVNRLSKGTIDLYTQGEGPKPQGESSWREKAYAAQDLR